MLDGFVPRLYRQIHEQSTEVFQAVSRNPRGPGKGHHLLFLPALESSSPAPFKANALEGLAVRTLSGIPVL